MSAITWQQSPERGTWVAEYRGARLAVSRLALDGWRPEVVLHPGSPAEDSRRGPVCRTRRAGQDWAERMAKALRPAQPGRGPFETERQARETPAVRAVWAAFDADPGAGKMAPHNLAMLTGACEAAGVTLGAYDQRILTWLAGWEPQTCAVVAGLITRARQAGGAR